MTSALTDVLWQTGAWTTPPAGVTEQDTDLVVTAVAGSDAWRTTAYGFIHDDAHGLFVPLDDPAAVEVTFTAAFTEQFDQAGVLLRADEQTWVKAGVELADGVAQVGAVVTLGSSDWSVAPVPDWVGRRVTVRLSRSGDTVTVRARVDDEPFRLVRVAPFPIGVPASAGPYCCAPSRSGLAVRFHAWRIGPADSALH